MRISTRAMVAIFIPPVWRGSVDEVLFVCPDQAFHNGWRAFEMKVEPLGGAVGVAGVDRIEDFAVLDDDERQSSLPGRQPVHSVDSGLGDLNRAPDAFQAGGDAESTMKVLVQL